MRTLATLLAVGGLPWAYFAAILITTPIGTFTPAYDYSSSDVALSLTYAGLAILGFYVWAGWLWLAAKKQYFIRPWIFWGLSAINHLGWLIVLRGGNGESPWLGGYLLMWIIVNLALAAIMGVMEYQEEKHA